MKKSRIPIIILISVIILIFTFSMLLSGCGRRARIARALQEQESESVEEQSTEGDITIEETTELEASDEEDASMEETTEAEETTEVTAEESVEETVEEAEELEEEVVEEETGEEPVEEEEESGLMSIGSNASNVTSEGGFLLPDQILDWPTLYVGDSGDSNKQSKGFVSFDISNIAGKTILDVKLSATCSEVKGDPFGVYGPLIVKAVYWGPQRISTDIFNIDGIELANFTKKNFGIGNNILKNDLQNAVSNGMDRYQLCLYFEMEPSADGDNSYDILVYNQEDITLYITVSANN